MNKEDKVFIKKIAALGVISMAFIAFGVTYSHAGSIVIGSFGGGVHMTIIFQELKKWPDKS